MEAKLFKNGQSLAVRLPAQWLKEGHFSDAVEMELRNDGSILIKPISHSPRAGWTEAAAKIMQTEAEAEWSEAGLNDGIEDFEW